jgi:uncharacterized lipoprotein YehR (DUF1307 family)
MHAKKFFISTIILVLVMMLGITSCSPGDMKTFEGILKQVDGISGNVTVTMKDGTTATFNLSDIELNAGDGGLSLRPGDNVTCEKDRNGKIRKVKVCYAEIQGTIKSILGDNVTVATLKRGDVSILVTPKTIITMAENNRAALADLAVGQKVTAKYEVITKNAVKIIVHLEKREAEIQGTIKNISGIEVTITVVKKGDITVNVTPETKIIIGDSGNATLEDLSVGQNVNARYEINTMNAVKIIVKIEKPVVKYAEIQGTIKDIAGEEVTITVVKKGDITVNVTPETKIIIGDSGNATLEDLSVGQYVNAKYETNTMNAVKIIVKVEKVIKDVQGTIEAIDPDNKTVSILVNETDLVVLNVTPETLMKIVGAGVVGFEDMDTGQSVEAKYYSDTMNAVKIYIYPGEE